MTLSLSHLMPRLVACALWGAGCGAGASACAQTAGHQHVARIMAQFHTADSLVHAGHASRAMPAYTRALRTYTRHIRPALADTTRRLPNALFDQGIHLAQELNREADARQFRADKQAHNPRLGLEKRIELSHGKQCACGKCR